MDLDAETSLTTSGHPVLMMLNLRVNLAPGGGVEWYPLINGTIPPESGARPSGELAAFSPSASRLFRLRLLQPEAHAHLTVQHRGGGQVLLGLVGSTRPPAEPADAQVAVGPERARIPLER